MQTSTEVSPQVLHSMVLPPIQRSLSAATEILNKAEVHAKDRGFDSALFLTLRLAPDMFDFATQVRVLTNLAKGTVSRLAGREIPNFADNEETLDDLRARVARTAQYVGEVDAADFAASLKSGVANPLDGEPRVYDAFAYARDVAMPNFYFHLTAMYAILRQSGVPLGKKDFEGKVPPGTSP